MSDQQAQELTPEDVKLLDRAVERELHRLDEHGALSNPDREYRGRLAGARSRLLAARSVQVERPDWIADSRTRPSDVTVAEVDALTAVRLPERPDEEDNGN